MKSLFGLKNCQILNSLKKINIVFGLIHWYLKGGKEILIVIYEKKKNWEVWPQRHVVFQWGDKEGGKRDDQSSMEIFILNFF